MHNFTTPKSLEAHRAAWCAESVYIKILLRAGCTIVSFHPEASHDEFEEGSQAPG
jgi:hypothetical protein